MLVLSVPARPSALLPLLHGLDSQPEVHTVDGAVRFLKHGLGAKALVAVRVADLIALLIGDHAHGDGLVLLIDFAALANSGDRLNDFRADIGFHFDFLL